MYNSDLPTRAELPTTAQLIRSTILAILAAVAILVTVVLPAEHAIDLTGIGRVLRLTEMGEIRKQLAAEAEADRRRDLGSPPSPERRSMLPAFLIGRAHATPLLAQAPEASDETVIVLRPTEGAEWKLRAAKGAQIRYAWRTQGGVVNYDMHGTPAGGGKESSYKTARGVAGDEGVLVAGFDGSHGWFFRNRGTATVTVVLRTSGAYTDLKRM